TNAPWPISEVRKYTSVIPIVFAMMIDPVNLGILGSLAHPSYNITGFTSFEYSITGKWLDLLKQIVPGLKRVGLLFNPQAAYDRGSVWFRRLGEAAPLTGVKHVPIAVENLEDLKSAVRDFASRDAGLVVATDTFTSAHYAQVAALAFHHRLAGCY